MKKRLLFLLPLFLGACSKSGESPVITIERLYVDIEQDTNTENGIDENANKENYANRIEDLPALKVGDKVDAFLSLDGKGAELKTFKLQNDEEVSTKLLYEKGEVSTEGNLTDEDKGQLRFKDGVTSARILVHATVDHVDKNGNVKLSFYLSSKAECDGAQEVIDLKTKRQESN